MKLIFWCSSACLSKTSDFSPFATLSIHRPCAVFTFLILCHKKMFEEIKVSHLNDFITLKFSFYLLEKCVCALVCVCRELRSGSTACVELL